MWSKRSNFIPRKQNNHKRAVLIGDPLFNIDSIDYLSILSNNEKNLIRDNFYDNVEDKSRLYYLYDLPFTKNEVENISNLLSKYNWESTVLLGAEAVEETIKPCSNPTLLHFATHGYFSESITSDTITIQKNIYGFNPEIYIDNPMLRSGLLLSGAENTLNGEYSPSVKRDNGVLTAYEVMNMQLDSTELVVLSACNTGMGEIRQAEGVYGLQRAFQLAGAKSILMSLWPVDDKATQIFMEEFYNCWLQGLNKREALNSARKVLLEHPQYNHPKYWGAFVLIGED
jgi:CHAT domain-containing protein